jgi:hypothetical protein
VRDLLRYVLPSLSVGVPLMLIGLLVAADVASQPFSYVKSIEQALDTLVAVCYSWAAL